MSLRLRKAAPDDVPILQRLIDASVRGLQAQDYTQQQIDLALKHVYGVDTQLIGDGTYFVVETAGNIAGDVAGSVAGNIVGCGGWSKRKKLYGGDVCATPEELLLDPWLDARTDAAKIRAFFVAPEWTRQGIASMLLVECETAAAAEGFKRCEMGSTLSGVALYTARGYVEIERLSLPLPGGDVLPVVRMEKQIGTAQANSAGNGKGSQHP